MLRQIHILHEMDRLPETYRTAETQALIDHSYDDCAASLLLPWLFGLKDPGQAVALK